MWNYAYTVPENKKVRVIVHTDCKNEADDQYAVAHHLMTPRFDVKGFVAGHFWKNPQQYGELGTAQASYDEIIKVMDLMGLKDQYPVKLGAPRALEDEHTPIDSEGARFIIEEAMKDDKRPLYIACQGAITDVASALLMKPEIAERMTVIWIGGADYPKGGFEFNLMMDINAVNVVFSSKVPVWQVPMSLYKVMAVSLAELQLKVRPCGKIGKYLFEQLVDFNHVAAKYEMDWLTRYEHGEFFSKDSIKLDESLRYSTGLGRPVYGGGGIMPDLFVPVDTTDVTRYFLEVSGRNILFRYTLEYADRHRDALNAVKTIPELQALLDADKELMNDFIRYAARNGVQPDYKDIARSRKLIEAQLRAYIGRNTPLNEAGFYVNIYPIDPVMLRAVEVLKTQNDHD